MGTLNAETIEAPDGSSVAITDGQTIKGHLLYDQASGNTLRNSMNVSSVTDDGTGQFTVNWDNDWSDTDYFAFSTQPTRHSTSGASSSLGFASGDTSGNVASTYTASATAFLNDRDDDVEVDYNYNCVVGVGDLA